MLHRRHRHEQEQRRKAGAQSEGRRLQKAPRQTAAERAQRWTARRAASWGGEIRMVEQRQWLAAARSSSATPANSPSRRSARSTIDVKARAFQSRTWALGQE